MRLAALLLLCLFTACTDTAVREPRACSAESARVERAKESKRRAMRIYSEAVKEDPHSQESKDSWGRVEAAVSERNAAQSALDTCRTE